MVFCLSYDCPSDLNNHIRDIRSNPEYIWYNFVANETLMIDRVSIIAETVKSQAVLFH